MSRKLKTKEDNIRRNVVMKSSKKHRQGRPNTTWRTNREILWKEYNQNKERLRLKLRNY